MDREIKYIEKRLDWLHDLEKELHCYRKQIQSKLKVIERRLK